MRKIILLLLAVLLLAGCTAKEPVEAPQPLKVGLCWFWQEDTAGKPLRPMLEAALREAGYQLTVCDGGNDQSLQQTQVEQLIADGVELLILEPVMPSGCEKLLETVKTADIPVVFVNRKPNMSLLGDWNKACFVGFDAKRAGTLQGQILRTLPNGGDLNGDGVASYLIIQGPEDYLQAQMTTEACAQAMEPGVRNLEVVSGDWSYDSGKRLCAGALSRYGRDVEVILCGNADMTMGALAAVEENGWVAGEDLYLVGMGGEDAVLEAVAQGLAVGTVYADVSIQADRILEAVARLAAGQTAEEPVLPYAKVTGENIDAFLED